MTETRPPSRSPYSLSDPPTPHRPTPHFRPGLTRLEGWRAILGQEIDPRPIARIVISPVARLFAWLRGRR